jgi:hypothetical protein
LLIKFVGKVVFFGAESAKIGWGQVLAGMTNAVAASCGEVKNLNERSRCEGKKIDDEMNEE